jgi:hypothetical protein
MLNLLIAAALTPIAYGFKEDVKLTYEFSATFEGFIPILGGQEGKAEVQTTLAVTGVKADEAGNARMSSDIMAATILFNDAPLPLTLDSVKGFFPKTTITVSPFGRTLKTDAPDVSVPVKLPGLDAKRFADLTYVPIEFPETGIEAGKSWTFKRTFDGSDMTYDCTATEISDSSVKVSIKVGQSYETLEDESVSIVKDVKDAANRVKTTMVGDGVAEFDRKLGFFRAYSIKAVADSVVTDIKTNATKSRKLATEAKLKLKPAKP